MGKITLCIGIKVERQNETRVKKTGFENIAYFW